jgi:hypothetical protein
MKAAPPLASLQRHLAFSAIGPTTLRNMFQLPGCRKAICRQLAEINLDDLKHLGVAAALDRWTGLLQARTGVWGPSRKALNLFLRDASYNYWTRGEYHFEVFENELELPLDGVVMRALRHLDSGLPRAPPVKSLRHEMSDLFQRTALQVAADRGVFRVHLDLALWNGGLSFSGW